MVAVGLASFIVADVHSESDRRVLDSVESRSMVHPGTRGHATDIVPSAVNGCDRAAHDSARVEVSLVMDSSIIERQE